jgi:hypothetical protein
MSLETMTKLQTVTVGAGGSATVSFTNIPQGYTDLKFIFSAQGTRASDFDGIYLSFNGSTDNFTGKYSQAITPSTPTSGILGRYVGAFPAANLTNKFGSAELYVSGYSSNKLKMYSADTVTGGYVTNQALLEFINGVWSNPAPITSISFAFLLGNFAQYSTVTLYGIKNAAQTAGNSIKATGGAIYFDGTYVIHAFNSTGSFTPTQPILADVVVIAGGGAAGATTGGGWAGGGGGAGGYRVLYSTPLAVNTTYVTTIGAGGAGVSGSGGTGGNGGNSTFGGGPISYSATGGGGGGTSEVNGNTKTNGQSGGSGGGGAQTASSVAGGSGNAGGYSPVEGYAGRSTTGNPGQGGGAGGVGLDSVYGTVPTPNGVTSLNGQYYAMGGYCLNVAAGSTAADPFTGNGGKSRNDGTGTNLAGGNGGSGTVLIRYKG